MRQKALIALTILASAISCCGCVTTKSTKGFQTNPVGTSKGFPHDFAAKKEGNGINKFFANMTGGKKKKGLAEKPDALALSNIDPTNLDAPATVSPDLLILAGEMGLKQGRFDLAASYFQRALAMSPNNQRALNGIASAKAKRRDVPPSGQPNQQNAKVPSNALGKKSSKSSDKGVQLVSHTEELDTELSPESITVEEVPKPAKKVEYSGMTLQPAIEISTPQSSQRVANPFFGTTHKAEAKKEIRTASKPTKKIRPAKVKFTTTTSTTRRSLSD